MRRKAIIERWDLLLTIVSAALAIVLLLFNVLPVAAVPYLLLTYMGIFAFNQMRENVDREEHLKRLEDLYGASIKTRIVNQHEFYILLQQAVVSAKHSVSLTHLEARPPQLSGIMEKVDYFKAMDRLIKTKRDVTFRRIYVLPDEPEARIRKLEWIRSQISTYKACSNFHARIFDQEKQKQIVPLLSLQFIDSSQMFMIEVKRGQYSSTDSVVEDFWTNDREVIRHLESYYETFWSICTLLKEGDFIEWNNLPS